MFEKFLFMYKRVTRHCSIWYEGVMEGHYVTLHDQWRSRKFGQIPAQLCIIESKKFVGWHINLILLTSKHSDAQWFIVCRYFSFQPQTHTYSHTHTWHNSFYFPRERYPRYLFSFVTTRCFNQVWPCLYWFPRNLQDDPELYNALTRRVQWLFL